MAMGRPPFDPRQQRGGFQTRVNHRIRVPEVRVIDADGAMLGVLSTHEALRMAQEKGLDLVEVNPKADPPVCKILDYGKFKYQQHKKESEAKKKATVTQVKELRLGYRTGVGDIERQIAKAREFLEEGDRVKFLLRFRGREMAYQHLGREKLLGVCDALKDCAITEGDPRMEGRMMGIVLAPSRKKPAVKPAGAPSKEGGEAAPAAESKAQVGPQA